MGLEERIAENPLSTVDTVVAATWRPYDSTKVYARLVTPKGLAVLLGYEVGTGAKVIDVYTYWRHTGISIVNAVLDITETAFILELKRWSNWNKPPTTKRFKRYRDLADFLRLIGFTKKEIQVLVRTAEVVG